jgi:2-keto-4-pentenoate hydratase/2-oxohepta-3-ene-1,7-dioic acid hydratase in catechol pathway
LFSVQSAPSSFFQPPSAYITAGQSIEIPLGCRELHHEIELGAVISKVREANHANLQKPETLGSANESFLDTNREINFL